MAHTKKECPHLECPYHPKTKDKLATFTMWLHRLFCKDYYHDKC